MMTSSFRESFGGFGVFSKPISRWKNNFKDFHPQSAKRKNFVTAD